MSDELKERIIREREVYDHGINVSITYQSILDSINYGPSMIRYIKLLNSIMSTAKDKHVLEIGSESWKSWIDFKDHSPKELYCINISQTELSKGIKSKNLMELNNKIDFILMDAHLLGFKNNSYDMIYGASILHHLNIERVLNEIHRVLRPGGTFLFLEPLIYNPLGQFVRLMTPNYRTPDEKPLGIKEINLMKNYFTINLYCFQFIEPIFSMVSYYLINKPINLFTKGIDKIDAILEKIPPWKYLYRKVLIYGVKK
jgi:SAM-dependent methyltransferase